MSDIIGLGGSIHDFSVFFVRNQSILGIEDERITRKRYAAFSENACEPSLSYCLEWLGSTPNNPSFWGNDELVQSLNTRAFPKINWLNHHITHAYSSFFTSSFERAAVLVIDGAGSLALPYSTNQDRETTTYALGSGNQLEIIDRVIGTLEGENKLSKKESLMSNSLGEFYRAVAESLNLGWLTGPGKMMGLAPHGSVRQDDRFVSTLMSCVKLFSNGQFEIQINGKDGVIEKLFKLRESNEEENPFYFDSAMANSAQIVLEEILFHVLNHLYSMTQTTNLCLSGGVALNSLANGKIPLRTPFKNIHVIYSPGDSGTALGAALYGYVSKQDRLQALPIRFNTTPYLGRAYSREEIKISLEETGLNYVEPKNLYKYITQALCNDRVVAWYQSGSEFGPRALGNRSILADPRNSKMHAHINQIKHREWYRPIAPVVVDELSDKFFDVKCYSPWMQFVWPVKKEYRVQLPAITHVDGSARIQSLKRTDNPKLYQLLLEFEAETGFPILINTSFNVNGEPIVETPRQAINSFLRSEIDILVMENFVVEKNSNSRIQ